jgi:hypothetical protein
VDGGFIVGGKPIVGFGYFELGGMRFAPLSGR